MQHAFTQLKQQGQPGRVGHEATATPHSRHPQLTDLVKDHTKEARSRLAQLHAIRDAATDPGVRADLELCRHVLAVLRNGCRGRAIRHNNQLPADRRDAQVTCNFKIAAAIVLAAEWNIDGKNQWNDKPPAVIKAQL